MDIPYFIKEHLCMIATDEAILKTIFGVSKPFSKLTLKTEWYHSCGCCDDSRSCEQLKKHVSDNYFEKKLDFENPNHLPLQEMYVTCM